MSKSFHGISDFDIRISTTVDAFRQHVKLPKSCTQFLIYYTSADLHVGCCGGAGEKCVRLRGANLEGAALVGTNFQGADLRRAYLKNAHIADIDLSYANLGDGIGLYNSVVGVPKTMYKTKMGTAFKLFIEKDQTK